MENLARTVAVHVDTTTTGATKKEVHGITAQQDHPTPDIQRSHYYNMIFLVAPPKFILGSH